jgi:hypothetical protein
MDHSPTIIWLVEQAVREWVLAVNSSEELDPQELIKESAYSVFYMDEKRPNQIQMSGPDEDRCGLWIEPYDVCSEQVGSALLVDVKIAHRIDGQPTVTEFQVSMTEDLKALIH